MKKFVLKLIEFFRVKILEKIGVESLFEINLITPEEYKTWYSHFIKEKVEI